MWILKWHFTNKSVIQALTVLKVTVTVYHTVEHYGEEYDDWNSAVSGWHCSSLSKSFDTTPTWDRHRVVANTMPAYCNMGKKQWFGISLTHVNVVMINSLCPYCLGLIYFVSAMMVLDGFLTGTHWNYHHAVMLLSCYCLHFCTVSSRCCYRCKCVHYIRETIFIKNVSCWSTPSVTLLYRLKVAIWSVSSTFLDNFQLLAHLHCIDVAYL